MEAQPPPSKIGHDKDRIGALPDELLLEIIERLSLRDAVRAGGVSTRWRHLPHQLARVDLDVARDFQGATTPPETTMDMFDRVVCSLLSACPPAESKCDCFKTRRAVNSIRLHFYSSAPHLGSIGRAVEDTVSRGGTREFDFKLIPLPSDLVADRRTKMGKKFMSFYHACPSAFRLLTALSLTKLEFGESDLRSLLGTCDNVKRLSFISCSLVGHSVLKIDVPKSAVQELEFMRVRCRRIELVSVPKLTRLLCYCWRSKNHPLSFGDVPQLLTVELTSREKVWQRPFALSECFSMNARSLLSKLKLNFGSQMIWIQPEHPKQLTFIFRNLTDVAFRCIFPECDLSWTLFILEASPALQIFKLTRARHSCVKTTKDSAEKTNVVWEPSKDLKHLNLKMLIMKGFEAEDKVTNYIRLVMERAVGLKRIMLQGINCDACYKVDLKSPKRFQEDKASRRRVMERLTSEPSSPAEIIIC
ncbi:unnamed protein product [Alopecurus aequalis]